MNVVFFTTGMGSGHAVHAASLFFALRRAGYTGGYCMASDAEYGHLVSPYFKHHVVPMQPSYFMKRDSETELYRLFEQERPHVLVADGTWLPLLPILDDFRFRKIILFRQFDDWWFAALSKKYGLLRFNIEQYDHVFSMEPGFTKPGWENIHPVIILNHNELLPREEARRALGARDSRKLCVIAHNGFEGEFQDLLPQADAFDKDYQVISTTNRDGAGFFPLAKYYNGIDFIVGAAGYNLFYETRYFNVQSQFVPLKRKNEDQAWRIRTNRDYTFTENGADELARVIMSYCP